MLVDALAELTGLDVEQTRRLLNMSGRAVYDDPTYQNLLGRLDKQTLQLTLHGARDAYEAGLPDMRQRIRGKFHFSTEPVTPYALANWLIGFLDFPDRLVDLLMWHTRVPLEVVQEGLPMIVGMLDRMEAGRREWKQAAATIALPLIACPGQY